MTPLSASRIVGRRPTPGFGRVCVLLVLLLSAAATPILGHAFWPTFYSSKSALAVGPEGLEAVVVIEIPTVSLVPKFRKHYRDLDLKKEIEEGRFEALEQAYTEHLFAQMAEGLVLEVDGERPTGSWQPVDTPINGRASEGFFVYMLEFRPEKEIVLGDRAVVEVHNDLYRDVSIVLANYVEVGEGWELVESSTPQPPPGVDLSVGSPAELEMWSEDPAMRDFRVVLRRQG